MDCPICGHSASEHHADIDGHAYYRCRHGCGSLFIEPEALRRIDVGDSVRQYDSAYWQDELVSARDRAKFEGPVRVGEAILYARRPVRRFLDVGSGPGFLLDQLTALFPQNPDTFHAIEMFPPDEHTVHPNYRVGALSQFDQRFDGGICIEVVEHLTPRMFDELAASLAKLSEPGALWLFNTGLPEYVLEEDPGYLDPKWRGHIVSYSLAAAARILGRHGFRVTQLPGKSFAYIAEYESGLDWIEIEKRIYQPLDWNLSLLKQHGLLYMAAFEAARAYFYYGEFKARTQWALSLRNQVEQLEALLAETKR